ncbi:hypothetical protein HYFRA_00010880, partial [Hymenoscyphus fraxineus]
MHLMNILLSTLWVASTSLASHIARTSAHSCQHAQRTVDPNSKVTPKVVIITMFPPESDSWLLETNKTGGIGSLFGLNVTVPGFSPIFPHAHCLADGSVCLITTGEGEINAASTMTALLFSPLFDLRKTYFLIAGIAGVNPHHGTLSDVAFAKFAVQVSLQYEFDAREVPGHWSTGYVPLGSNHPDQYPGASYGTEVFELSGGLRDWAWSIAKNVSLTDSSTSAAYRANYQTGPQTSMVAAKYRQAVRKPSIIKGDVVTSDVYFSGTLLGESVENTTKLFTNGSAIYTMTAQEDNATLETILRAHLAKLADFRRVILMRSAADFDRPYPGLSCLENLFNSTQGAFQPSLRNLYLAGEPVVRGILREWKRFEGGVEAGNYVGDVWGSLGGRPEFGPGVMGSDNPVQMRR